MMFRYIFLLLLFYGCAEKYYHRRWSFFSTYIDIKAYTSERKQELAFREIFERFKSIERKFSIYNKESPIYRLNLTGESEVDDEILGLISRATYFSEITDGAFDITIYPLAMLWKKAIRKNTPPEISEISKAKKNVNYKLIRAKGKKVYLRKGMGLDFGGIAKGYAVDVAIKVLKKYGVKKAIVNVGGNIYGYGKNWIIGIQHPRKPHKFLIEKIFINDKGVATSGDYEKFFIYKGKRYHHIIDPRTGFPGSRLMSATVIADDATIADALSTSIFLLGVEKAKQLRKKLWFHAILVDLNENVIEIK